MKPRFLKQAHTRLKKFYRRRAEAETTCQPLFFPSYPVIDSLDQREGWACYSRQTHSWQSYNSLAFTSLVPRIVSIPNKIQENKMKVLVIAFGYIGKVFLENGFTDSFVVRLKCLSQSLSC